MKYNKIAMLVAGGLMVASGPTSFAATVGAVTGTVAEHGALLGTATALEIEGELDGSNTMQDLNSSAIVAFAGCVESNSTITYNTANESSSMFSEDYTNPLAHDSASDTLESGARDIGGFSLALVQNKLVRSGGTSTVEDDVIAYKMWVDVDAAEFSHDHKDPNMDQTCDTTPITISYKITDSNKDLKAGDYALGGDNTITLSGQTDGV
jgi:hypothetical protein